MLVLEVVDDSLLLLLVETFQVALIVVFRDGQEETAFGCHDRILAEVIVEQRVIAEAITLIIVEHFCVLALALKVIKVLLELPSHPHLLLDALGFQDE